MLAQSRADTPRHQKDTRLRVFWDFRLVRPRHHSSLILLFTHLTGPNVRNRILSDPTAFEEPLLDTTLTVLLDNSTRELISVSQFGLGSASTDALGSCIQAAKKRWGESKDRIQL
jgi:exosome complex RNA-binding protein Rrp42 (RNase PH superfamily)